jgi:DNA polymerase III alpha subunit
VRRFYNPGFRLADIPLDDPDTGNRLAQGDTIGVFQCESSGAQRTLRQLKARNVQDLAVANAFFKPGPALGGMARAFVRRYRGAEAVSYLHPALKPILGRTKGVLIFQEQILRIATEIAGLTWEQADHLRRGMSHFGRQEMAAMQAVFVAGCMRPAPEGPAFTEQQARTLWEQVLPFAGYGFNQGHATAYADVSYRSAYLKTHYPAAFLCARLADWGGFHHPAIYMAEAVRLGIPVHPPHVNFSDRAFTLHLLPPVPLHPDDSLADRAQASLRPDPRLSSLASGDAQRPVLYMGLGQVRDLREASVQTIVEQRQQRPFTNLRDLLTRVSLQGKEITHLIQCGALDGLGASRASLLAEAAVLLAGSVQQLAFGFAAPEVAPESLAQRLTWEQHLLGQPVGVHPLDLVRDRWGDVTPLRGAQEQLGRPVITAGVRLPGWTGGQGFFLGDAETFVIAIGSKDQPMPVRWQPIRVHGRWQRDEWGVAWLHVQQWEALDAPN